MMFGSICTKPQNQINEAVKKTYVKNNTNIVQKENAISAIPKEIGRSKSFGGGGRSLNDYICLKGGGGVKRGQNVITKYLNAPLFVMQSHNHVIFLYIK